MRNCEGLMKTAWDRHQFVDLRLGRCLGETDL